MRDRVEWDDLLLRRPLGDAGMWALVPLLLSLGGGFLIFISIFAGEFLYRWDFLAGGFAAFLGLTIAALMFSRGGIVALVLIAVGASGGWVWEQFRDGASIDAVTYIGGGYDGSHWVGNVDNYEERAATVTCQLEALSPEGDVIGTVEVTATDVRPNGGQFVEGEIDVPPRTGAAAQAQGIMPRRNLRSTCTTEIVDQVPTRRERSATVKLSADEVQADDRYVYEVDGGAYTVNGTPPVGRVPWSGDFTVSAAGVTPIPLHAARHTYAEIALAAGVRLDVVSRQLGHASIATTGNIYTHDSDEAAQEAAACWGNFGGMREPGGR